MYDLKASTYSSCDRFMVVIQRNEALYSKRVIHDLILYARQWDVLVVFTSSISRMYACIDLIFDPAYLSSTT